MSGLSLTAFTEKYKKLVEQELKNSVSQLAAPEIILDSMHYSLSAGGKRIRPLLTFATMSAFGKDPETGLLPAAAIEMIHTYSLIHDDLPSMDDDDLRRGIPTNHKVYGEAIAILAGDALLTYAFQLVTAMKFDAETKIKVLEIIAKAAGAEGMVGGQVGDIEGEGKNLSKEDLEYIHVHKTGKMLEASILIGAVLAGADKEQMELLTSFAYHLGLAFQIRDDILDVEGDEELIGKPLGSDVHNHKSTYPALLTMDGAKKELTYHISAAKEKLNQLSLKTGLLEEMTDLVGNRNS
ncbi:polyprenyl synthetase family protein [Niallia taxi]|uniref:Farnesyl diphosphate synthase n=1 Tax=Niallia taxi TaxID=2499688 RepID=A0A3S2XA92_9BACI|nr:farnesyl diphosphate synthase [Niallia taxi]MCM3215430.1 polyprenyl synthetase family protein [Niallia taxi]MDK8639732.1 polyprenyl synthetase family protein [Niallia taxi]MED4038106.1 polyprenyl synthetase family protein [Niallia taxi]RVT65285.1 polyprenyl synthetase family protein [Niallia taxi]